MKSSRPFNIITEMVTRGGNSMDQPQAISSEIDLCRELHQPRRRRTDNLTKCGVADVSVDRCRTVELSMIEYIEGFEPELNRF